MCLISMKYRIIILIIIIISPGQISLSYIANTSRTHAHTWYAHTHTHRRTFRLSLFDGSVAPTRDARSAGDMVYCCVPECKSIHLTHLSCNGIANQERHKERYHAWLTKIRRDPGPLSLL